MVVSLIFVALHRKATILLEVPIRTRSNRREYWIVFLTNFIICIIITVLGYIFETKLLNDLYQIIVTIPSISVAIRRLHDINKSGWWYLIIIIPIIGLIWLIILLAKEGDDGNNDYGNESLD